MVVCNAEKETEMIFLSLINTTNVYVYVDVDVVSSGSIRSRKYVYIKFTYACVIELNRSSYTRFCTWGKELG